VVAAGIGERRRPGDAVYLAAPLESFDLGQDLFSGQRHEVGVTRRVVADLKAVGVEFRHLLPRQTVFAVDAETEPSGDEKRRRKSVPLQQRRHTGDIRPVAVVERQDDQSIGNGI